MRVILISASSDIGTAASERWLDAGWSVFGTYRTRSTKVDKLRTEGAALVQCDLTSAESIDMACKELTNLCTDWDVLVLAPGTQDPIGPFLDCDFKEWESSLNINFVSQIRIVRKLMDFRSRKGPAPTVLFFAGGGTNGAVVNYSAYTVSKIALIKMCELLDAEVNDTKFVILGPGWVKTKIHDSTLRAKHKAGDNFQRTLSTIATSQWTPMKRVLDCCDWMIGAQREVVSGRNFSVVHDAWNTEKLQRLLLTDHGMYKLRRNGNEILIRSPDMKAE